MNEPAIIAALQQLAKETEVFALRFRDGPDGPRQYVDPARVPAIEYHDLRERTDPEGTGRQMMADDIARPLDLEAHPLSALWLLRVGDSRWLWYMRGHHIILDGYSASLIERRAASLYAQQLGQSPAVGPLLPFAEYLTEEDAYRNGKHHQRDGAHWAEVLRDAPPLTVLQKGGEDYACTALTAEPKIPAGLPAQLRQTAAACDLGWPDFLTLLSAAWLARDLPEDVQALPVWLPYMSRLGSVSAAIPALVVNILPLIVTCRPDETLGTYLQRTAADLRKMRRHGRYRVEQLAADRGLKAGERFYFSPLINVLPFDAPRFAGCTVEREVLAAGPGDGFNLTWGAGGDASGLFLSIDADPASETEFTASSAALVPFIARACEDGSLDETLATLMATDHSELAQTAVRKTTQIRPIAGRLEEA